MQHPADLLRSLAAKVGTPYWLYDARVIRQRIADIRFLTDSDGVQARFAMKACPATRASGSTPSPAMKSSAHSTPATPAGTPRRSSH
jgi:hypothetical protein